MSTPRSTQSHIRRPAKQKRKKLSRKARQLIHHLIKTKKLSLRQAARALRLPNHGQLDRMLKGRIGETDAMKAAVLRAETRARRAFFNVPLDDSNHLLADDLPVFKEIAAYLERSLAALTDAIRRNEESKPPSP